MFIQDVLLVSSCEASLTYHMCQHTTASSSIISFKENSSLINQCASMQIASGITIYCPIMVMLHNSIGYLYTVHREMITLMLI